MHVDSSRHCHSVYLCIFFSSTFLNNTSELSGDTSAIAAFRFPMVFSRYNRFDLGWGGVTHLVGMVTPCGGGVTLLAQCTTGLRATLEEALHCSILV